MQIMLTSAEAIESVRHGISINNLDRMVRTLGIEREVLLEILGISTRTLQRKFRANDRLSPLASDRLSRVERIFQLAAGVFGDEKKAAEWLKRPSRALDNELPIKLLDTDAGTQQVEQELRRIEYGFVF
jgi:putative toxin-antitoxin system antitoxin component (TIGR02293 family)